MDMADLDHSIDANTRLVAVSAISYINGFEHDLKAICDLAHSRGALVYADLVQAAGAMPIDVRQSGVDFAACASYKWLQGDFGLGFLYIRKDLLSRVLVPPVHSYRQFNTFTTHMLPDDPPAAPGAPLIEWTRTPNATGTFEQGTLANAISETLAYSLNYIQTLGVANIQKHSQSLTSRLRRELPPLGYPCITPAESRGPLVAFTLKDPAATARTLKAARIDVTISASRMRVSPSVYNDEEDIDRLVQALKA
jgi:selenocysteine lyase/cysteine desulfurase